MTREEKLQAAGVHISYKDEWRTNEATGQREPHPTEEVEGVFFPFSAEMWVSMCSREGQWYAGGCCGNLSAFQDYLNGIFRDGGRFDASDFLRMGSYVRDHEGFEMWKEELTEEEFDQAIAHWGELGPWDQMGLVYQTVQEKMRQYSHESPRPAAVEERDVVTTLSAELSYLDWANTFASDESHHAQAALARARLLPMLRELVEAIEAEPPQFEGFAITDAEGEIQRNLAGLCLYATREQAEEVVEIWRRNDLESEQENSTKAQIRPAKVTAERGLELGDSVS